MEASRAKFKFVVSTTNCPMMNSNSAENLGGPPYRVSLTAAAVDAPQQTAAAAAAAAAATHPPPPSSTVSLTPPRCNAIARVINLFLQASNTRSLDSAVL